MGADLQNIARAAEAIFHAEGLLFAAGAGMGVDSGLPDFRGDSGFWKAYPPYQKLGLKFVVLANPRWFQIDPALAWGFYGHRLNLYRSTQPHPGFEILRLWARKAAHGNFVYTSNVDGHFLRADFDSAEVYEVHGSIHWLQCTENCGSEIFPADGLHIAVDKATMRAGEPLPRCPQCGALARPNILMFNDGMWDSRRSDEQADRLERWLAKMRDRRLVIIECGAGTAVPTVRRFSESVVQAFNARLIRINLREPEVPEGQISLALSALGGLQQIQSFMAKDLSLY